MRAKATLCLLLGVLLVLVASGCGDRPDEAAPPTDRLDWWREARFGLFVHWGLYAVPAGQWDDGKEHAEWIRTSAQIPLDEYDAFREVFDPQAYDPDAWCRMAAEAGMRYVVITSKHHDGFCLWDSKATEFDVANTPYAKDLLKPLAEACRAHDLVFCVYHSIMDWHHPDYLPRQGWERETRPAEEADFDRYVEYLHRQVTELLTEYGDVGILWFDGFWDHTWNRERGQALYDLCRELQPNVIVNDRVGVGRLGHSARIAEGHAGDYGTPEQTVPEEGLLDLDWETCLTMNRFWGWNEQDEEWKSGETLIRTLVDVASKNGNLLLNVGPRADGSFPPRAVERLKAIGAWMDVNGEAIYGTTGSPLGTLPWGRCTAKRRGSDSTLYLAVFDWSADGTLVVPNLGNEIQGARILGEAAVTATRRGLDVHVAVPAEAPIPACTVVALDLKGPPIAYRPPTIQAPADLLLDSLLVRLESAPGLVARYTVDGTDPTGTSPRYEHPLRLGDSTMVRARAFHGDRAVSAIVSRAFEKVTPWPAVEVTAPQPGLRRETYPGTWEMLPDFDALEAEATDIVEDIDLAPDARREFVARRFSGFLEVPRDGVYVFLLESDDGSRLVVDGKVVVDNDGLHGLQELGGAAPLAKGLHAVSVEGFNNSGAAALRLRSAPAGKDPAPIAPGRWHQP